MAVKNITMPQLGESVTEGTISRWLVGPGDEVNKYDPLAEVLTDKVNAEIPSSFSGTIKEIIAQENETLAVGEIICTIDTAEVVPAEELPKAASLEKNHDITGQETESIKSRNKPRYSPAVVRMAQEYDIDLNQVDGTGLEGRITRKDLQKLINAGEIPTKDETSGSAKQKVVSANHGIAYQPVQIPVLPGDTEIPITNIRRTIAANMVRSKQEIPHAWMMVEVDVTGLVQFRNSIKDEFKLKEGFNLTYFAFFVKAVAQALREYPMINSVWAGDKIVQKKDINLSIAVASEDVLYVPVIKNADEQSIKGIAKEIAGLANKARNGRLRTDDIQGGTFTVNNTGSFGSIQSMGIINHPQAAILQIESIVKRPVILKNGGIAARDMVNLCLSMDHRVLDGLVCGNFLKRVKEILENISRENTSVY
ncbi:MAG TPA: 2-oxo acid dehydrogenase subunit E2 [Bacillus bacterium]|uniref:Dihydrolipoamide acetyltransferase component of pyruvate dehydrogenase complex n=1 Tax=Siminovitchia fordii TaxID=254759 RepID=A0ABQ4K434_9BACI|nr:dihydrolipoamide acetyltransferase family protein [Siminovitchia fordii]GIN19935.1 dihydrolipoamide acetyltransferase component of pyruvate dehydrogenase complex [Siminovitchia fordii]HBZ08581.1 2-oxo acid dehydrogenase subunit E2 [Bacillus sp. (in: firmicutes)]